MFRAVFASAALALGASQASAQITTYVAPARPVTPDSQLIAQADSIRLATESKVALNNMKAWVDSASGVTVPANVGDTLAVNDPGRPVATTFSDGSVAPATASDLPALIVGGTVILLVGAALITHRSRS